MAITLFSTLELSSAGSWDLAVDGSGNIATLSGAAALEQDVASAAMTFFGEVYYDTTIGVPYLAQIFAQNYSPSIAARLLQAQVQNVPNVASAQVILNSFVNRNVSGSINFMDVNGTALGVII